MPGGDNRDNKPIQKYDDKAAVMEEQLIVRDNSLEMDLEKIDSDTGQMEDNTLPGDKVRVRSDSVDSDLMGLAELGLLASLADAKTRKRIMSENCDLSHIDMPTVGDSTDDEQEGDDDDNMSSCCSDSADFKEWTTLRPDDENIDSSKIAALSSAFSSYISSPKHLKRKPQQDGCQDSVDPNMGQFLLPLVTEQLPMQDLNPTVETDHSVIEVLAAEAKRYKKVGDEMSALAWRILGGYHALENAAGSDGAAQEAGSIEPDEEEKQQVMQLISKCINEDETLVIFQELNKEIQDSDGKSGDSDVQGIFSKILLDDTLLHCMKNLESETVGKLKNFSDTNLVKSVLRCINGEKPSSENPECEDTPVSMDTKVAQSCVGEEENKEEVEMEKDVSADNDINKTFKFLENSPLRYTLEQYMMMQIASREAEAEQNQRLLRELGGITSNNTSLNPSSVMAGNIMNIGNSTNNSDSSLEEPAQRIFDCDTVNTISRFIELDDSVDGGNADKTLCPGGCGNLKHCSRYRNNGANHSPSNNVSSPKHMPSMEEDEGIVEEAEVASGDEGEQEEEGAASDKQKIPISEVDEIGRIVDAQSGWWELRALLCGLWRAAEVGSLTCKSVAMATIPPCHCCRCSHPMLRKLPRELDPTSSEPCQCQQESAQHPNQPRERCRSCLSHSVSEENVVKQVWGGKVDVEIPPVCCCQERRSTRAHHSCIVRLFFKDSVIAPMDFDLSKTEFEKHDLQVDDENGKFLNECHRKYLDGEDDIPRGDEDMVPLCTRCRCKCGRAKFYCPKVRDRTIKQNIDNFTRLAPQLLILRLDTLCSALCAWHGAHLSKMLAEGAVMTFLKELWRRAAAMRNGGIALSGILGPTRRRLATVCGRLLAPHQYLSGVYRAWANRAAAARVVHLSMLQLLGKAPPQTVEALHSFSSLLSMMNEAETLRGDVTTFLGNYQQCERDEYLVSLRLQLVSAQKKNLAIARFFGLLSDDPCELKGHKSVEDCESSIVARSLSECLPTDPAELEEFKRIIQAMLLYHSSGGGIGQLSSRANRILSSTDEAANRKDVCQQGKRPLEHTSATLKSDRHTHSHTDDNMLSLECGSPCHSSINKRDNDSVQNSSSKQLGTHSENSSEEERSSEDGRLHSAAVLKRRLELEKEFVQREKSRIINTFVNALNSTHYSDDLLTSALFQDSKTSSEISNRPRPVKRKLRTNDMSEEMNNAPTDSSQASTTTTVTLRMKPGCHKAGIKQNRISKSTKGGYVKSIRRASIGHMSEVIRKEPLPTMKTISSSPKAVRTINRRGRSVSLYSETRRYLESAIREYETVCPINTLSVSGTSNVLRWYSMPDMSSRDSDSDTSVGSAAEALTSLKIEDDPNKLDPLKVDEYRQKNTKELNSSLKGLASKLIPEMFLPSPSSVDPFIDIQLKKDFDVYVKDSSKTVSTPGFNENVLEKLRKPVFDNETPEQRYLRMQMCECLEKMELLGLEDQEQHNKTVRSNEEDDEIPSPPLELSPTIEKIDMSSNLDSKNKRRLLSLNQTLMTGKASDINSLLCSANDIMTQEKNILKDFIDFEISSKKESELTLDDLKLAEALPFLEISSETNEKQQKDSLNMKIHLPPKESQNEAGAKYITETKISHLHDFIRERGIRSDGLKRLLHPLNLMKSFGTKNLWNLTDDLSLLTPETIKQLKEVRQECKARMKKQTCGKRKITKKSSDCMSNKGFSDKAHSQASLMEDPTKEEIMTEMLGHRHRKKGFKNAREFQAKLFTASLQVVMRKVLQVLMPCDDDIELDNLKKSGKFGSPYDVKVGNEMDGCNIDDYWDGIKAQFGSWRAFTLEQYWNLPEHYHNSIYLIEDGKKDGDETSKSSGNCFKCQDQDNVKTKNIIETHLLSTTSSSTQDEQKKHTIRKTVTSKVTTLDPAKAKSFLSRENAVLMESYQAMNKDYIDKLLKQNLTGEGMIIELQNLERKLKSAVKEKSFTTSSNSSGSCKITEETSQAELVAGRGLRQLINQESNAKKFKETKQDLNSKTTKPPSTADTSKTDKASSSVTNQPSKTVGASSEAKHKEDTKKSDLSQQGKLETAAKSKEEFVKKCADALKEKTKSDFSNLDSAGKTTPAVRDNSTEKNSGKNGSQPDCLTCAEHIAGAHGGCDNIICVAASTEHICECCHGCQAGQVKQSDASEKKQSCTQQKQNGGAKTFVGNGTASRDKINSSHNKIEVETTGGKTVTKYDGNTAEEECSHAHLHNGEEFSKAWAENKDNTSSPHMTTKKETKPAEANSKSTPAGSDGGKVNNTGCAHAPAVCKGDHHHHHSHQHTCNNANQRESEACVNHNSTDGVNRCSQHSASSRGAGGNSAANNNSANNSGNSNGSGGNSDQPCNCCYCTVFGHAPPVTTPVSKNFNETRERLRSILNRKKQRCRPGSSISSQGGGDSDSGDVKSSGKGEETPSIIPITPTVKPDPLPISTIPKQKPNPPAAAVVQPDLNKSSCAQIKQQPTKTAQTTNAKPAPVVKPATQTQQQNVKNTISDAQKPNLPLKLKIKQSDGQMAIQDMIKKEAETAKNTTKNVTAKDLKNIQNAATAKKDVSKTETLMKAVKCCMKDVIKKNAIEAVNAKGDDKKPPAQTPGVVKKPDVVQKQDGEETDMGNNSKRIQEKEVEEQNSRNAKKHKMAAAAVNESKGIQTDKPRSQSLQPAGNPQPHAHHGGNIQKTGPQPLQTHQQAKREQNRAKDAGSARTADVHHPVSSTTSRDCSVFSTSTVCSGCSVDPRDLDMLIEFIEGPGSVMDKIKKKAKKARQKIKKMVEKLETKLVKSEARATKLRAESNKLDKLLVATVGKKKKPNKKGKKKGDKGDNEVEDESVITLRKTARDFRERAAQAEKELEDGRRMLNRVAKALLLIGSTEDVSQLPEVIAVQQQVSLMSSLDEKDEPYIDVNTGILSQHLLEDLKQIAAINSNNNNAKQQQNNPQQQVPDSSRAASLDQILANSLQKQNGASGKPPSQCMVTIKRVMIPESGEPSVTITPKGSDKPIYTFQNHTASMGQQIQQQQHQQQIDAAANKKKAQGPSWESTLAQINSLSQGKKKKENANKQNNKADAKQQEVEKQQEQTQQSGKNQKKQQPNSNSVTNDKTTTSVNSSLYPSRSTSTVSELSSVDMSTAPSKKQRKLLAKKLRQEEEERERLSLEEERLAAQKGGNKKNKGAKRIQEEGEEDPDPEKIVLSMRQLKTAVERALEAMDSDANGQKLPGKGKLKDNAKEFIEKVVSKVEETKKATAAQSNNTSGKRIDKVVDISEVVLGSFSGKIASATGKHQSQQNQLQLSKNNQQNAKNQKQNANQNQQQQQAAASGGKKQKQKDAGNNSEGLKFVSGKGAININTKKNNNAKKNQVQNQSTTSVHHRSVPMEAPHQQVLLSSHGPQVVGGAGLGYHQSQFPVLGHHPQQPHHKQQQQQLNANYMDKINLNSDITIQLANENENACNQNDMNIKPGGPVSCSIMEQLRNGVQVPDLKLPPGITLTWVDPNKKQPDPTPKAAIPVVKLSSVAPEYRPTPPVVNPPPLIMVDTKSIPHNRDPKTQVAQSAQVPNQPQDSNNKSKSKKSKKKTKKPPANLIKPAETSTHSHQRVEEQPKMVTLRNPMFHPTMPSVSLSSVQSGKRVSESIRIPDPIPMPPNACQATITPTSNGMFTIRNPLMSMVHQQNMMAMKETPVPAPNAPVVLMSSTGSVLTTDINQMKDHGVNVELAGRIADMGLKNNSNPSTNQQMSPPNNQQNKEDSAKTNNTNPDFLAQNLSFTPNKENRGYSLFKSEEADVSSSTNAVTNQRCQESNVCPSPIGSKTNRVPPVPMNAARQLDFNPAKQQINNAVMGGWQDSLLGNICRKSEDMSSDSGIDGGPPGFYTPFGQAESDKLFGSLLFQNSTRDDHEVVSNPVEIGLGSNESKQVNQSMNSNGNRGDYRQQPAPVGYGAAKNSSVWNGPYSNNYPQQEFPQSGAGTTLYQTSTNATAYGQNFQPNLNQNYMQIRSSHSSSSSGLMTGSVISSGTNSVYDSVSNSSSNSPADATNQEPTTEVSNVTNITNIQQSSPEGRNYGDFSPYVSMLQQQPQNLNSNSNFNAFGRVTDSPATIMAEILAANRDRLIERNWYTVGNQMNQTRNLSDTLNQLRLSDQQNMVNQQTKLNADFNADLAYYNAQRMQSSVNNFSPNSSNNANAEVFRQVAKLHVDPLQLSDDSGLSSKYGTYGVIGQAKQQPIVTGEEGQATKNLGAIGSHRNTAAPNGLRQEEYYPGDSRSIFAPDQTIGDLNELESAERDIESFKRFHFYFEPPKNKPKITLNLKDIKTRDTNQT